MNKRRLIKYLVLTFAISWTCWLADALLVRFTSMTESGVIPMILFTLGGFGPTIAACCCIEGGFSKRNLTKLLFHSSKKNWLFCIAVVFFETLAFSVSSNGLTAAVPSSPIAVLVVCIVFLQATVLYGGNEELGWRGTMQPILQKRLPTLIATLITGVVWVTWHIPLWFIEGNSHQGMSFVSFAILGIALSYWLSAIYDVTGAVVFCMILHGWTNTLLGLLDLNENCVYNFAIGVLTVISVAVSIRTAHVSPATIKNNSQP